MQSFITLNCMCLDAMNQIESDSDDVAQITVTVDVDAVVFALKMNDTGGADDRVIAVPQNDGGEASIRRAFRGSERYSNPEQAPIHIRPEALVEDPFTRPPTRGQIDCSAIGIPELPRDRDEDDEAALDEAHEVLVDEWEVNIAGMIAGEHSFDGVKGNNLTLIGERGDE